MSGASHRMPSFVPRSAGTVLEFIGDERVSTASVAGQFGWSMQRARRELNALHDQGLVMKTGGGASMNDWRRVEP